MIRFAPFTTLILTLSVAGQMNQERFQAEVATYAEAGDLTRLGRLFRTEQNLAVERFLWLIGTYRLSPTPYVEERIKLFKKGWRAEIDTQVLEEIERHVMERSDLAHRMIQGAERDEHTFFDLWARGRAEQNRELFDDALGEGIRIAGVYEQYGFALGAARMWRECGAVANTIPNATEEDTENAIKFVQRFVKQRERWGFTTDRVYIQNLAWLEHLERERAVALAAASDATPGVPETKADRMVVPDSVEVISPLEFKVIAQPHASPFALAGPVPVLWLLETIRGPGPTKMRTFTRTELFLVRPSAAVFGASTSNSVDLAKNPWQEVVLSQKFVPSVVHLGPDGTDPYAFWFYAAGENEPVFGVDLNLEPQDDRVNIYYRSAASWTANLAGEVVTFFDDNANGLMFERDPYAYGLLDKTRLATEDGPATLPAYDSMRVGDGPVMPLSTFVRIGDGWHVIRGDEMARDVGIRPADPNALKLGKIQVEWRGAKNAKVELLVIEGVGRIEGGRFDVGSGEPIEVPVGQYAIQLGRVGSGKGARRLEAVITRGKSSMAVVEEGKTTKLVLGGDFAFDFDYAKKGTQIEIDPLSFAVYGRAGERYSRICGATPAPEVLAAKDVEGRGSKSLGEFLRPDQDAIIASAARNPDLGGEVGFLAVPGGGPAGSLVMRAELPNEDARVGLREKRNKLFGNLESAFK